MLDQVAVGDAAAGFAAAVTAFFGWLVAARRGWLGRSGFGLYERWRAFVIAEDRRSDERIHYLEQTVDAMKSSFSSLQAAFEMMRSQLDAVERDRDQLKAYVMWQAENPPPPYVAYRDFLERYHRQWVEELTAKAEAG